MKVNSVFKYNTSQRFQKNVIKNTGRVVFRGNNNPTDMKNADVVEIFKGFAKIPSPPLKEEGVADWIMSFCKDNEISAEFDNYRNIKINIPATDETKEPLLFSAHMDVVGDDSPVNIVTDGKYLKTDGTRTLGADDKAGIAAALRLAREIVKSDFKHGGVEMLFTRDEELGFTGINNVDFKNIKSKYALVLDEATLGNFDNSGAGYTTVTLSLTTPFGGHSGMDIADSKRVNAAKAISEIIAEFPQGMYYSDNKGEITSINVGTIIAGDIQNSAKMISENKIESPDYLNFFMENSVTNVINTRAMATLSIRSSNKERENELRQQLTNIVDNFNQKYDGLAAATIEFDELMPAFKKTDDSKMEDVYKKACKSVGLNPSIGTFPACAETHVIADKKNKNNEFFVPVLLGVANIDNMHSPLEQMDFDSLKKGYELIKQMFWDFNS